MPAARYRLETADEGAIVLESLEVADRFVSRLIGLQFRADLAEQSGLWLRPCSSLHTCFMRFPIDVLMLDRDGILLETRRQVLPWRLVIGPRGTESVVETRVGATDLPDGTRLAIVAISGG